MCCCLEKGYKSGYDFQMISKRFSTLCSHYDRFLTGSCTYYNSQRHIFSRISDISKEVGTNESKTVRGWIKSVRKLKNLFFLDVNDGSTRNSLQVVIKKTDLPRTISYGSSVVF